MWPGEERARLTSYQSGQFWRGMKLNPTISTGSGVAAGEREVIEIQAYQKLLQSRAKRSVNHRNAM